MTFCMLIAGSSSPFLWRAAPGLLLLALLLSGLSVLSLAVRARRIVHLREERPIPMPPPRSVITMLPTAESVRKIGSTVFLLSLGLLAGYAIRNQELASNTRTYFGVAVLSQQSEQRYMVRIPGDLKDWDWEFCHPVKMPSLLIDIRYEQRFGCKAVNGVGFVSIHEEKKNAQLQVR